MPGGRVRQGVSRPSDTALAGPTTTWCGHMDIGQTGRTSSTGNLNLRVGNVPPATPERITASAALTSIATGGGLAAAVVRPPQGVPASAQAPTILRATTPTGLHAKVLLNFSVRGQEHFLELKMGKPTGNLGDREKAAEAQVWQILRSEHRQVLAAEKVVMNSAGEATVVFGVSSGEHRVQDGSAFRLPAKREEHQYQIALHCRGQRLLGMHIRPQERTLGTTDIVVRYEEPTGEATGSSDVVDQLARRYTSAQLAGAMVRQSNTQDFIPGRPLPDSDSLPSQGFSSSNASSQAAGSASFAQRHESRHAFRAAPYPPKSSLASGSGATKQPSLSPDHEALVESLPSNLNSTYRHRVKAVLLHLQELKTSWENVGAAHTLDSRPLQLEEIVNEGVLYGALTSNARAALNEAFSLALQPSGMPTHPDHGDLLIELPTSLIQQYRGHIKDFFKHLENSGILFLELWPDRSDLRPSQLVRVVNDGIGDGVLDSRTRVALNTAFGLQLERENNRGSSLALPEHRELMSELTNISVNYRSLINGFLRALEWQGSSWRKLTPDGDVRLLEEVIDKGINGVKTRELRHALYKAFGFKLRMVVQLQSPSSS